MRGYRHRLLLAFLLLGITACAMHVPRPTLDMAGGDLAALVELRTGYEIYRAKCSGCHALLPVEKFSPREWPLRVDEMVNRKKVRFEGEERERLISYLASAAAH